MADLDTHVAEASHHPHDASVMQARQFDSKEQSPP